MNIFKKILKHRRQITRDHLIFYLWPLLASLLSFWMRADYYISLFLFFLFPALYLFYRNKKRIKKILLFSLSLLLIAVVLDYICDITGIWVVSHSIINYRILGQVSFENILWLPLYAILVVAYYEYFYEFNDKDTLYKPRLKYLYAIFGVCLLIFLAIYFINKDWLYIQYFYLKFGIILVLLPMTLIFFRSPYLFAKFAKTGLYFFYLSLIYELTALYLNWWSFPGRGVIGQITIDRIMFPVEELFFWIIFGSVAGLAIYEFFDDDEK